MDHHSGRDDDDRSRGARQHQCALHESDGKRERDQLTDNDSDRKSKSCGERMLSRVLQERLQTTPETRAENQSGAHTQTHPASVAAHDGLGTEVGHSRRGQGAAERRNPRGRRCPSNTGHQRERFDRREHQRQRQRRREASDED